MESGDHQDQMEMMLMMQMEKLISHDLSYSDHHPNIPSSSSPSSSSSSPPQSSSSIMDFTNINITSQNPMSMSSIIPSTTTISFTTSPHHHHQLYPSSSSSSMISHHHQNPNYNILISNNKQQQNNSVAAMREMIFRIAAMQPIHIDPESVKPPKRRNVKISKDPQSVAARHRRERISERIRILQRLVPGGTKMDTASMLDEAIHYVKFLKNQVQSLERAAGNRPPRVPLPPPTAASAGMGFPVPMSSGSYLPMSQNHIINHVHH